MCYKVSNNAITVRVQKLDTLARQLKVRKIDFIKIDTEGAELMVLKGSKKILMSNKPRLIMEIHGEDNMRKVRELLKNLGYQYISGGKRLAKKNDFSIITEILYAWKSK